MMLKNLWKPFLIISLIYFSLSAVLCSIPLFNVLGYEFALVFALASYVVCGISLSLLAGRDPKQTQFFHKALYTLSFFFLLSLIPPVFMVIKGIFVTNCNYFKGLRFYLLLASISSIFGASLAYFLSSIFGRRLARIALFLIISLLIFSKAPYDILYGPAVDIYNHTFGYFAGPIYDEIVEIVPPLIFYRMYSLTISLFLFSAGSLIFMIKKNDHKKGKLLRIIPFLTLAALVGFFTYSSSKLGFTKFKELPCEKTWTKIKTDHFNFYYDRKLKDRVSEVIDEFEFRHYQNSKFLHVSQKDSISVYIYPDPESQKFYMGSRGIFIGKPSNRQIHMTFGHVLSMPIKHELIHVMAGEFGMPILKISPRIALFEGLAVAAEEFRGKMTLDEYSAALTKLKLAPDIKSIMGLRFWSKQSAIAYYLSGSFTQYLIRSFGMEKFKAVYRGESFKKVYGKDLTNLSRDWLAKIGGIKVSDFQLRLAESIFKPKGIFRKRCAHEVASLIHRASICKGSAEKPEESLELLRKAYSLSGNYTRVGKTLIDGLLKLKRCDEAKDIAKKIISNEQTIPWIKAEAYKIIGDCYLLEGKTQEAGKSYTQSLIITDSDYSVWLDIAVQEILAQNHALITSYLRDASPQNRSSTLEKALQILENTDVLDLMLGKLYFLQGDYKNSLSHLAKIEKRPDMRNPNFHLLAEYKDKLLGQTYFFLGDFDNAYKYLERFMCWLNLPSNAQLLFHKEWKERIEFTKMRKEKAS